jgi:UDP-GlcNAc:undecaprenyl-phosphate GlcNAc-1-phosphate transferase
MIGLIDDYLQVRARWQLAGQVVLAGWAIALGISVGSINNPFGPGAIRLDGLLGIAFTLFWIVGMINAINFIDGLDGLSAGIGLIAALTLGVISLTTTVGQPYIALFSFVLAGALLGFLRWNFHPAVVFAGTSGTMFLGYCLAILSILGTAKVAVALLVLGVPIIDTFWIIVRRLATGRAPFSPDRGHIHHRLLDLGLSHTAAVLLIYALCVGLALLSLVLSGSGQYYAFLGLFVAGGLAVFLLARRSLVAEELRADSYEAGEGDEDAVSTPDERPTGERPTEVATDER